MTGESQKYVYSPDVVEFMTVAVQTCVYLEDKMLLDGGRQFVETMQRLLPVLYVKTQLLHLPETEMTDDGLAFLEQFCNEDDYNTVFANIRSLLGSDDAYLAVGVEEGRYDDIAATRSIAEDIADIYQELKDVAGNYRTHDETVMQEALAACLDGFVNHWGLKLLDAVRALHVLSLDPGFQEKEL